MKPAGKLQLSPLLFLLLFVGVSPFLFAFVTSFFHDVYGERSFAGFSNFIYLFSDKGFAYSMAITVLWAGASTVLTLTLGFFLAVQLMNRSAYSNLLYGALLIPWGIPVYIAVPLWRAVIQGNGSESILSRFFGIHVNLLTDGFGAFLSTLLVSVWLAVPITAFVFLGSLTKLSRSMAESARVDGAHSGQIARHIYLPSITPAATALGLLHFIGALKEFTVVFLMTNGGPPLVSGITERSIIGATTTLGVFLYEIFGETSDFGVSSAYTVTMMGFVLLMLLFWVFSKNGKRKGLLILILVIVAQPVFGGWQGFIWAAVFALGFWRKRLLLPAVCGQILFTVGMCISLGFFEGFHVSVVVSILGVLLLREKRGAARARFSRGRLFLVLPRLLPLFFIIGAFLILGFLVALSLSSYNILTLEGIRPQNYSGVNFIRLFREHRMHRFLLNTLLLALVAAAAAPCITFPAAAALVLKGKRFTRSFLTGVQILSVGGGIHTLIALYSQFIRIGFINSYAPLVLIYCYQVVPFSLFTMTTYLNGVPKSLFDQARIDGTGPFRLLWKILVPVSLPVITTTSLVTFLSAWNSFMAPLLFLNDDLKFTISVKLFSLVGGLGSANPQWNIFAAASVINMVIIGFLFLRVRRPAQTTALQDVEE
jgi:multiple sugar transport system permease protein